MTPEQKETLVRWADHIHSVADNQGIVENIGSVFEVALQYLQEAVAIEREECARVAESWQVTGSHPGVANAIRARGQHAPPR